MGDQFKCDIVGAREAGMFPVWYIGAIDTQYFDIKDVLTVKDWKELREFLSKI